MNSRLLPGAGVILLPCQKQSGVGSLSINLRAWLARPDRVAPQCWKWKPSLGKLYRLVFELPTYTTDLDIGPCVGIGR